jgi:hypothetical protein
MPKKYFYIFIFQLYLLLFFISCDRSTGPKDTLGSITGTVMNGQAAGMPAIHPAYIFSGDTLLATTDEYGKFSISEIQENIYNFTCSALYFRDTTEQIHISGGKTVTHDFYLIPDSTTGLVYGEFQDLNLFNDSLVTHPGMADWDAEQIWQGVTGATLQTKTLHYNIPDRNVYLGDSLLARTDGFAQYAFRLQCGTYQIKGTCEGYYDATEVVKITPDHHSYVNFFLIRVPTPKFISKR